MIDYDKLQTSLVSISTKIFGNDVPVYWRNSAEAGGYLPYPHVQLQLRSETGKGVDYPVPALDNVGDPVAIPLALQVPQVANYESADRMDKIVGQRSLVLVVHVESDEQTPLSQATPALLSKFVQRLRRPDIQALMKAGGFALSTVDPIVDLDFEEDGRMLSVSSVDITLITSSVDEAYGVQEVATVSLVNQIPDPDSNFEVNKP